MNNFEPSFKIKFKSISDAGSIRLARELWDVLGIRPEEISLLEYRESEDSFFYAVGEGAPKEFTNQKYRFLPNYEDVATYSHSLRETDVFYLWFIRDVWKAIMN